MKKKEVAAAPATTKTCPLCQSTVSIKAPKCAFCTAEIPAAA